MNKKCVKTKELFECNIPYLKEFVENTTYPWEMLPQIKAHITKLTEVGLPGFEEISEGVFVGKDVKIHPSAVIIPPAIIGNGTEIRPEAYLRGNIITGENCVIGNSSELKNCILMNKVQVPHYNYVGDAILGNYSHMGAGSICSNLKSDKSLVVVHGDENYETGIKKFSAILGDYADIGCGCVLNPGTVIGMHTNVYPLTSVRGVIPENSIVKSMTNIVIKEIRN